MAKRRDEGSGRLFLGSPFCFCAGIGSMHLGEPTDPSPLRKGRGRSVRERGAVGVLTRGQFVWPADWKSAIQRIENVENLRYGSWTARSVHGEPVFAFAHAMGP
ncbi:hypothetical protein SBV1_190045 [Verrucomicrobia bacterium]|nr:hypothetical protein SBV1_190045 [Verrucomicrobiota bacterium]